MYAFQWYPLKELGFEIDLSHAGGPDYYSLRGSIEILRRASRPKKLGVLSPWENIHTRCWSGTHCQIY